MEMEAAGQPTGVTLADDLDGVTSEVDQRRSCGGSTGIGDPSQDAPRRGLGRPPVRPRDAARP